MGNGEGFKSRCSGSKEAGKRRVGMASSPFKEIWVFSGPIAVSNGPLVISSPSSASPRLFSCKPPLSAGSDCPLICFQRPGSEPIAGLPWQARWISRSLRCNGYIGMRAHAASLKCHGKGQVEPFPSDELKAGVSVNSAGAKREEFPRRRTRAKKHQEPSISFVTPEENAESAEVTRESYSEPELESGVPHIVKGEALTASSLSSPRSGDVLLLQNAYRWSIGGVLASFITSDENEQQPEKTKKKSRTKSKKVKNALGTSNLIDSLVSDELTETQPAGGFHVGEDISKGDVLPYLVHKNYWSEGSTPLTTVSTSGISMMNDNGKHPVTKENVGERTVKSTGWNTNPVIASEQVSSEHGNLQNSSTRAHFLADFDLEGDGTGFREKKVQSNVESNNGLGIDIVRKKRKKKTARKLEKLGASSDSREDGDCDTEWSTGNLVPRPQSQQRDRNGKETFYQDAMMKNILGPPQEISRSTLAAQESLLVTNDEGKCNDGIRAPLDHKKLHHEQKQGTTCAEGVSRGAKLSSVGQLKNRSVLESLQMLNQGSTSDVEQGEMQSEVSSNPTSSAKSRRTRRRKKGMSGPVQTETTMNNTVLGADNLFDSIIWCTVHLKVQGDLEHYESLHVVGANPELGGWDLSLALPLIKSDEQGPWETTLKIPRGTMLEYKYFTEFQGPDPAVVDRCFGPEMQYFLPWKEGDGAEFEIINDIWIPDVSTKLPLLSWGNCWWEDLDSVEIQGEEDMDDGHIGYSEKDTEEDSQELDDVGVMSTDVENLEVLEKPLVEDVESSGKLKRKSRKRALSREETLLAESMIVEPIHASVHRTEDMEATLGVMDTGSEFSMVEQKEQSVQVEILINSPQCTMQRMAILENAKLVELLIEPVNNRVQVGNIYLGVVRQLLPGMTGAFVDIGGFQLALMEINRNQYPHTFPSISNSTTKSFQDKENRDWDGEETEDEDDNSGDDNYDNDEEDVDIIDEEEEANDKELYEGDVIEDPSCRVKSVHSKVRDSDRKEADHEFREIYSESCDRIVHPVARADSTDSGPKSVNFGRKLKKWRKLQEGMQVIVQVKKEALGKKGPRLTAFPSLAGRFWVLIPGGKVGGVSRRITGPERKRLRQLGKDMQPVNFALTVRSEALGREHEELEKDLARLMETWNEVLEHASVAAGAAELGLESAVPVLLHRAMGQTLSIVRDFFTDKVHRMVIDSPQCYQEVTSYLQEVAPQLSHRVELYTDKIPIFDAFGIEPEIEKFSSRRVSLPNGGYLIMEETEALVSIDVNGGTGVFSRNIPQEEAILAINLAAARQIATEMRLRDMGGIIVVDFIDMQDPISAKQVVDEMRLAIARDRSSPTISEISEFGLMEMTRKRVRPSVTSTISDPCSCCGGVGRVEAHETTLSKIERAVLRSLAFKPGQSRLSDSAKWPQFILRVDPVMAEYLKGRRRKRITQLSTALKVWLNLKVALEFNIGMFQLVEQHRADSEKRSTGSGLPKLIQQNIGPGLLRKRAWPGKHQRSFAQLSEKES